MNATTRSTETLFVYPHVVYKSLGRSGRHLRTPPPPPPPVDAGLGAARLSAGHSLPLPLRPATPDPQTAGTRTAYSIGPCLTHRLGRDSANGLRTGSPRHHGWQGVVSPPRTLSNHINHTTPAKSAKTGSKHTALCYHVCWASSNPRQPHAAILRANGARKESSHRPQLLGL